MSFTDKGKFAISRMLNVANMSYNPIRENKILAKISEFTVFFKMMSIPPYSKILYHTLRRMMSIEIKFPLANIFE